MLKKKKKKKKGERGQHLKKKKKKKGGNIGSCPQVPVQITRKILIYNKVCLKN